MTDKNSGANAGGLPAYFKSAKPWIHVFAQMADHSMTLAGVPARQFYWDARTLVETTAEVAAYYEMDDLMPVDDVYNFEIEGMGGKMIYSDNAMPTIDFRDPLIKQPEDLRRLETPDFHKDGRLPYALESIRLGLDYGASQSRFCSPFSMAVGMRTYPALIMDMRKRPQFAHELLTFIVEQVIIPYLRVQNEYCGITSARGADAWACIPNFSVKDLQEWVVPYNQRMASKAEKIGVEVASTSGDYCEERLEKFDVGTLHGSFDVEVASLGTPLLFLGMGRWQDYPLEPVREYTRRFREQGKRVGIIAGVNARLLRDGPVEHIVAAVRRFVDAFGRDHDLRIFIANIPADTPPAHVHAAVAAAHVYGRTPIADNLDEVDFKLPERESFHDWKRARNTG